MTDEQSPTQYRRRLSEPRATFSFRIASSLRDQLQKSANEANRTLSEEVEMRLAQSLQATQAAPKPDDFEARVRQIVRSMLDERADPPPSDASGVSRY